MPQPAIRDNKNNGFTYRFINYKRGDTYNGFQNAVQQTTDWKGWHFNNEVVITSFDSLNNKGTFWRPTIDLSKQLKRIKNYRLGFRYAEEQNTVRDKVTDSITPAAFSFDSYSVYLRSDEAKKNRYGLTFFTRSDKYAYGKSFIRGDQSLNLNLQAELLANAKRQFYLNTTFRKLKVLNSTVSKQAEDETILGRAEYVMNELKGFHNR